MSATPSNDSAANAAPGIVPAALQPQPSAGVWAAQSWGSPAVA